MVGGRERKYLRKKWGKKSMIMLEGHLPKIEMVDMLGSKYIFKDSGNDFAGRVYWK